MPKYTILIDAAAFQDIQEITDWYNKQSLGLGSRFQKQVKTQINKLEANPHFYAVRYSNVRCSLVRKFPFLIHFVIAEPELQVRVYAVIHTSRDPTIWEQKTSSDSR